MKKEEEKEFEEIEKNYSKKIKLNDYLANYSKQRVLDSVFTKWIQRLDATNKARELSEWQSLFKKFLSEVN